MATSLRNDGVILTKETQELQTEMRQGAFDVADTRVIVFSQQNGLPYLWVQEKDKEACKVAIAAWSGDFNIGVSMSAQFPEEINEEEDALLIINLHFSHHATLPDQIVKFAFTAQEHLSFLMAVMQFKRILILAEEIPPEKVLDSIDPEPAFFIEISDTSGIASFAEKVLQHVTLETIS